MSTYDERRKARIRSRIAGRKNKRKHRSSEDVDRLRKMAEDSGVEMTDAQLEDIARGLRDG